MGVWCPHHPARRVHATPSETPQTVPKKNSPSNKNAPSQIEARRVQALSQLRHATALLLAPGAEVAHYIILYYTSILLYEYIIQYGWLHRSSLDELGSHIQL